MGQCMFRPSALRSKECYQGDYTTLVTTPMMLPSICCLCEGDLGHVTEYGSDDNC